jgi:hypothetical protein
VCMLAIDAALHKGAQLTALLFAMVAVRQAMAELRKQRRGLADDSRTLHGCLACLMLSGEHKLCDLLYMDAEQP